MWLLTAGFPIVEVEDEVKLASLDLEHKYQISEFSKGANQVDITLIAYARKHDDIVVTFEAKQHQRPTKITNYKIPLICIDEGVEFVEFVEMLDRLGLNM